MAAKAPTSHPLADLYVVRALDPIVDLARELARDFVMRPQHHTRASAEETALLGNFRLLVGRHPEWPNAAQRSFASANLFARMCQSFGGIRLAAIQYMQSVSDSAAPIGRRSFVESAGLLRATVQPLEGAALTAIADTHSTMLKRAVAALGSARVAAAFGMPESTVDERPEDLYSPRFAYLCESIWQTLPVEPALTQAEISSLQRAAKHGAATIVGVCAASLDGADEAGFAGVVHSAAAWATALGEILSRLDVARAWQDPAYRSCLSPLQRDMMPPHPSGEVDLEGTVRTAAARFSTGLGFSTETVAGEVCCCTGDLVCTPGPTDGV
jgi:mersacidin/lichenicidin family type 2 lantibiotic